MLAVVWWHSLDTFCYAYELWCFTDLFWLVSTWGPCWGQLYVQPQPLRPIHVCTALCKVLWISFLFQLLRKVLKPKMNMDQARNTKEADIAQCTLVISLFWWVFLVLFTRCLRGFFYHSFYYTGRLRWISVGSCWTQWLECGVRDGAARDCVLRILLVPLSIRPIFEKKIQNPFPSPLCQCYAQ